MCTNKTKNILQKRQTFFFTQSLKAGENQNDILQKNSKKEINTFTAVTPPIT